MSVFYLFSSQRLHLQRFSDATHLLPAENDKNVCSQWNRMFKSNISTDWAAPLCRGGLWKYWILNTRIRTTVWLNHGVTYRVLRLQMLLHSQQKKKKGSQMVNFTKIILWKESMREKVSDHGTWNPFYVWFKKREREIHEYMLTTVGWKTGTACVFQK